MRTKDEAIQQILAATEEVVQGYHRRGEDRQGKKQFEAPGLIPLFISAMPNSFFAQCGLKATVTSGILVSLQNILKSEGSDENKCQQIHAVIKSAVNNPGDGFLNSLLVEKGLVNFAMSPEGRQGIKMNEKLYEEAGVKDEPSVTPASSK